MRKVLIYRADLLPISETFVLAQAAALKSFEPRFIGLCRPDESLDVPADSILLTGRRTIASVAHKRFYRKTGIAPVFHRTAGQAGASLVHAHFGPDGVMAARVAKMLNLPLVVTLHGYDVTITRQRAEDYAPLWEQASQFLCVSEFIRARAIQSGFPADKLKVHFIGIDLERFHARDSRPKPDTVLFVGRLVQKKGCEYLLRAMAIVQAQRPSAELAIIGDGPLRSRMESLARSLRVRCTFLGAKTSDQVREALQTTRVFCSPSVAADNGDSEGFGMVFAEAQAMGVPVVSFAHGGIPEVVQHGITGILAPERDHQKLAEGVLHYLSDDQAWQGARERGQEWVRQRFDITAQTAELEAIYEDAIAKFPARS